MAGPPRWNAGKSASASPRQLRVPFLGPISTTTRAINHCTGWFCPATETDGWHEGGQIVASPPRWKARGCVICGKMGRQFQTHRRLQFHRFSASALFSLYLQLQIIFPSCHKPRKYKGSSVGRLWHGWQVRVSQSANCDTKAQIATALCAFARRFGDVATSRRKGWRH